jgi:polyketide synthase PksN
LAMTELVNILNVEFELNLSPAMIYSYPTITDIVDHLSSALCVGVISNSIIDIVNGANTLAGKAKMVYSRDVILQRIRCIVEDLLGARVDDCVDLMEEGLESLAMTELVNILNVEFELNLSPAMIYSYPTITDIVDHLSSALRAEVDMDC